MGDLSFEGVGVEAGWEVEEGPVWLAVALDEKNLRSRSRFFVGAVVPVIIPSTDI